MENTKQELKLIEIRKGVGILLSTVNALIIKNSSDMVRATGMLTNIVARRKRIEELRLFFTKPLNDQVRKINKEFKEVRTPYEDLEKTVKNKIRFYRDAEAEKLEKARKKAEEKRAKEFEREQVRLMEKARKEAEKERKRLAKLDLSKKDEKAELKRIAEEKLEKEEEANREEFTFDDSDFKQKTSVHSNSGSINVRKVWNFRIRNENEVPRHYLIVDEKAIRLAVRKGVRMIGGVDIFEEEQIGTRNL